MELAEELVSCPFCKENGFDLIGLKNHIEQYCEVYPNIISAEEARRLLREAREATRENT